MISEINMKKMTKDQRDIYNKFLNFCKFRNKVGVFLSLVILFIYYLFILLVGLAPHILGYKIGPSTITVGILWGLFIIITCIVTTGLYTLIANKYFDRDLQKLVKEMKENSVVDFVKG